MKRILIMALSFVLLLSAVFAGTVSGVLTNGGNGYYYVALGPYSAGNSLQNQVFSAYKTQGGQGIWYNDQSWTLDNNPIGQHVSIVQANITNGTPIASLVGQTFTFTYTTTSNGAPSCIIFNASSSGGKNWLVVPLTCTSPVLQSVGGETLHSSIAYNYNSSSSSSTSLVN